MGSKHIPINDLNQTEFFESANCPPVRRLTTPRFRTNLGLFRIHLAIISPQPEELEGSLPLTKSQAEYYLEAIADTVKLFKQELR